MKTKRQIAQERIARNGGPSFETLAKAAKLTKARLVAMLVKERMSVHGAGYRAKVVRRFYASKPKVNLVMLVVDEGLIS